MVHGFLQDFRYGFRRVVGARGHSLPTLLVLSLALGPPTALAAVINGLFFVPHPVASPETLSFIYERVTEGGQPQLTGRREYEYIRSSSGAIAEFAAFQRKSVTVETPAGPYRTFGELVSVDYFRILGVKPERGRVTGPADHIASSTEATVVISHDMWHRHLGGSPEAIGAFIRIDEGRYTVIGIMPKGFRGLSDALGPSHFWIASNHWPDSAGAIAVVARQAAGGSVDSLQSMMTARATAYFEVLGLSPERRRGRSFIVLAAKDVRVPSEPTRQVAPAHVLYGALALVSLTVLIAVVNVGGLLLAKARRQWMEVAVRVAFGARRRDLVRHIAAESVILATGGVLGGVLLAQLLAVGFALLAPARYAMAPVFDSKVWLFVIVCASVVVAISALVLAFHAARVDVARVLAAQAAGSCPLRKPLRRLILAPQLAGSTVLLFIAGTLVSDLLGREARDRGYELNTGVVEVTPKPKPLLAELPMSADQVGQLQRTRYRGLMSALSRALGGTPHAVTDSLPSALPRAESAIIMRDDSGGIVGPIPAVRVAVSPKYFEVIGTAVRQGRTFGEGDDGLNAEGVAVLSGAAARQLWPSAAPIGRHIAFAVAGDTARGRIWLRVVGVAEDTVPFGGSDGVTNAVYVPLGQQWQPNGRFVLVRSGMPVSRTIGAFTHELHAVDPELRVSALTTISDAARESLFPRRFASLIMAVAAIIAALLACMGVYGVLSYAVYQRETEWSVRKALGADGRQLVTMMLRDVSDVLFWGGAAGVVGIVIAVRGIDRLTDLFPSVSAASFVGPAVLFVGVLFSMSLPARIVWRLDTPRVLRGSGL